MHGSVVALRVSPCALDLFTASVALPHSLDDSCPLGDEDYHLPGAPILLAT